MPSTINDTIRHLLMEDEQVCLPGIGTLRRLPQPALISPLEGKAAPPSEQVTFNANLVLDDGRILRALKERDGLAHDEAVRELNEFLQHMKENLDAGRSFTVDGLGRFFKHFDGQVSFTSGGDNYSKDSFGLPAIELRPIIRTEKQRQPAADPMLPNSTTAPAAAPIKKRLEWTKRFRSEPDESGEKTGLFYHPELRKWLWLVVAGLSIIVVAFGIYTAAQYLLSRTTKAEPIVRTTTKRPELPSNRINVSPEPRPVDADRVAPDEPPRLSDPAVDNQPYVQSADPPAQNRNTPTSDASTTDTGEKTAYIATGMYGSQRNVEKNIDRIRAAGFDTFARPEGRLTRIGVRLEYTSPGDLNAALERLQRIYPDAFVLE